MNGFTPILFFILIIILLIGLKLFIDFINPQLPEGWEMIGG